MQLFDPFRSSFSCLFFFILVFPGTLNFQCQVIVIFLVYCVILYIIILYIYIYIYINSGLDGVH